MSLYKVNKLKEYIYKTPTEYAKLVYNYLTIPRTLSGKKKKKKNHSENQWCGNKNIPQQSQIKIHNTL